MKVLGLAPLNEKLSRKFKKYNVTVYALKYIELSIETVCRNKIVNWAPMVSEDTYNLFTNLYDLKLKSINGKFKGIICYDKIEDAARFIVDEYIPCGTPWLEKMFNSSKVLKRNAMINMVSALISRQEEIIERKTPLRITGTDWKKLFPVPVIEKRMLLEMRNEWLYGIARGIIKVKYMNDYAYFSISNTGILIYVEDYVKIGEHKIPRWKLLIAPKYSGDLLFYWNGEHIHWVLNKNLYNSDGGDFFINLMGEVQYNYFNRNATSIKISDEYLPPLNFKVDFLIKVPTKKILETMPKGHKIPASTVFSTPLFLYDARGAVNIPEDCKIIETPSDVLGILARTVNNVAMPDDYPSVISLKKYLKDTSYYIACGRVV